VLELEPLQSPLDQRPGGVRVDAGGGPRGCHDHPYPHGRLQEPVLPPSLVSTRTSVRLAAGSRALTMSMSVNPATAAAVSASISTPVRSAVLVAVAMST